MFFLKKKLNPRRKQVRDNIAAERFTKIGNIINSGAPVAILILLGFVGVCSALLSIHITEDTMRWKSVEEIVSLVVVVLFVALGIVFYIHHYQSRIIKKHTRVLALAGLFILLMGWTKLTSFFPNRFPLTVGTVVICAIVLTIAYNQRFAIGLSIFYAVLAYFAAGDDADMGLFFTMMAGIFSCCFALKEIRTRKKLLEFSVIAAATVFVVSVAVGIIQYGVSSRLFTNSGWAAVVTIFVGMIIQALLPLIEKVFRIATSMTLLDYSDANQPLLKKLAMEAPGTFSHSLLIGSIAETAAESIGANGLLCRVGAYYHDIGKIGKPRYFVENQMGSASKHEQLSPAMSQLIIVGHVKDGIEMAKEYGLPAVLRQFIETHHGTTLVEYFFYEAKKKTDEKQAPPSEAEFRYPGPRPQTKEAAIVMLSDAVEGSVRSVTEITPTKIETAVHNIAMRRLQDGQFDQCELTLRELSLIEASLSKTLAAHYHGRIAYPKAVDDPEENR